jgi:uncharacterized membrane protein
MSITPQSAQDDLAYLRSLVGAPDGLQKSFGLTYLVGGLCYGVQMILSGAQHLGWLPDSSVWSLAVGFGPTVVFLAILTLLIRRGPKATPSGVNRAISAVFSCVGVTNLVLIVVIGAVAIRLHSVTVWLIYPCSVFVLQGAAWLIAYGLRRRPWLALVALGWFVAAFVMAWFIQDVGRFILAAGVGLLAGMVIPGVVMLRLASKTV